MKKLLYISQCLLFIIALSGCEDWLDVEPITQIEDTKLFETKSGFYNAINGVYYEISSNNLYGKTLSMEFIEILAQRYDVGSMHNAMNFANYKYGETNVKNKINNIWADGYNAIAQINLILLNLEKEKQLFSQENFDLIKGEALALRAMLHFDVLRLFGPVMEIDDGGEYVPYYDEYTSAPKPLLTAQAFITKVLKDLTDAENLMVDIDPIYTDDPFSGGDLTSSNRFFEYRADRLNIFAVQGLMARVHLYNNNKIDALLYANKVIEKNTELNKFNFGEINSIFHEEVIFSVYQSNIVKSFEELFKSTLAPEKKLAAAGNSEEFLQLMFGDSEADNITDYRLKLHWKNFIPYHFYKYENNMDVIESGNAPANYDRIPMIRLSEVYYIAAECETDPGKALELLNTIYFARGRQMLDEILDIDEELKGEYMREFMGEGQLFFYYKRKNTEQILFGDLSYSIDMDKSKYVLPLPVSENENR